MNRVMAGVAVVAVALTACGGPGGTPDAGQVDSGSPNLPPVAAAATLSTAEDTPLDFVLDASDPEGATLAISFTLPAHGTLTSSAQGFRYAPAPDFHGSDAVTAIVSDGTASVSVAVSFTVTPVNDAPVAQDDSVNHARASPVRVMPTTLLANDTDVEGDPLALTAVANASAGTVALVGGVIELTLPSGFTGAMVSFEYTVSDGAASDVGTAVVILEAPANAPPVAVDDTATVNEYATLQLQAPFLAGNDTDPEGQALTVTSVGNAQGGTVSLAGLVVTFVPTPNISGPVEFEYVVSDGQLTDTGKVVITVTRVNDPPDAGADTVTGVEDQPTLAMAAYLLANDTDPDSMTLDVTAVGNPTHGTVALANGAVTFTPAPDFFGTASYDYTVSDGTATATGHVTVTITPVNDAPVAVDDAATTPGNTPLVLGAMVLLANDVDVDSTALSLASVSNATNGTVSLSMQGLTFTPASNFSGTGGFDYVVSDGTATDTGHVTVLIGGGGACGDGQVDAGETCDDGFTFGGDGCSATCQVETGFSCTGAPSACTTTCGDGVPAGAEACDDFNQNNGDGCSNACGVETGFTCSGAPSACAATCGDGLTAGGEACDDFNQNNGDGCSNACQVEAGFTCTGAPSACTTTCGDGLPAGPEACDDGDADDTDGCTTQCVVGKVCNATAHVGGDRFRTDPATGTCYVSFDDEPTTWSAAHQACNAQGGYLATISGAAEQAHVAAVHNPMLVSWLGATEDANDTDAVFDWFTNDPWTGYAAWAAGEPDDDSGAGGNGECVVMLNASAQWGDTNCDFVGFVTARLCEFPVETCGNGLVEAPETCDDGNRVGGDMCPANCGRP